MDITTKTNHTVDYIREQFNNTGRVPPAIICFRGDNDITIIPFEFSTAEEKSELLHLVRQFIKIMEVTEYIIVSEAWVSHPGGDPDNRGETVLILGVAQDGTNSVQSLPIDRSGPKPVLLPATTDDYERHNGLLLHLFPTPPKHEQH